MTAPACAVLACAALACAVLLGGCAGAVDVEPAPDGTSDACAALIRSLPATVAGQPQRGTGDTPGVAAWGEESVVLRCGTDPIGPTADTCLNQDGVDWVILDTGDEGTLFRTYGRAPAVDVEVPPDYAEVDVLADVADAVAALPQEQRCS